ncbi:hypothetical protein ABZ249_26145 [Nocardiopsis sp. NPDC006139]|uniref:hypothetical protein n=1 Tax=Nocardiopsis sp. NPDC006139 TaxID=3154578 RepID=UPI0033B9B4CB
MINGESCKDPSRTPVPGVRPLRGRPGGGPRSSRSRPAPCQPDAARTPGRREGLWAFGAAALLVAGCLLLASGPSLPLAALALALSGLPVAALLGLRSHMIDLAVPPGQRAGYFSWAFAAQNVGFAAGSAALAVVGQPVLLTAASLATLASLVVAVGLSRSLREPAAEPAAAL